MIELLPTPFFVASLILCVAMLRAWEHRYEAWGIPALAVYFTVGMWYFADILYNDYDEYVRQLGGGVLDRAWWQVCLFLFAFAGLVRLVSRYLTQSLSGRPSRVLWMIESRQLENSVMQGHITTFTGSLLVAWVLLMAVALYRVNFDFVGLFAPYLGHKAHPWSRGRIGGGLDAVWSLAHYVQLFITAGFGVIAALSRNRMTRGIALVICLLAFPYYFFDRSRNVMIAILLPGLLSWVFIRNRAGIATKFAILLLAAGALSFWFAFVLNVRTDKSVSSAFAEGVDVDGLHEKHHLGLNMLQELGWVTYLIEEGSYRPNLGERYFAELVNPIPRSLWPGKPQIGIDYAIARGQGGGTGDQAGVHATVSTGMIGQGVVNFGMVLGPVAAALIMSLWVGILARQDLCSDRPGRLLIYAVGLILTFNMGRDITLLVLYPYLFGWLLITYWERRQAPSPAVEATAR